MSKQDFDMYVSRGDGWYECTILDKFNIRYRKTKKKVEYPK